MTSMFNEGYRLSMEGKAWRKTPPGVLPGETPLERSGNCLNHVPRGPVVGSGVGPSNQFPLAPGGFPTPIVPSEQFPK